MNSSFTRHVRKSPVIASLPSANKIDGPVRIELLESLKNDCKVFRYLIFADSQIKWTKNLIFVAGS